MLYFKDLFNKLYIKFSKSKFVKWLFPIFLLVIMPNVYALGSLNGTLPLEYGNSTYAYNYVSATDWSGSITLSRASALTPYYTNYVTTGTYGIGFGQFLNGILLPKHYYRITWVTANGGGTNCGGPNSWSSQLRTGTGNGNNVQVSRSYFNYIGLQQNQSIVYDDGSVETGICAYTIVTAFSGNVSWINFPVNSSTTKTDEWFYYGYYIEDIGSTDTISNSDLQNAITNMQNSINSNANTNTQNIINNQNQNTNAINGNIDQEFNDLKNQDHTYNNNAKDTPSGQSDINSSNNKETQLMQSIDLDSSVLDVTLNTSVTSWIWEILTNLRSINGKITLLFITVLSLGIIKMVLNR